MGLTCNITKDYFYQKSQKKEEEELIIERLKEGALGVEEIAALAKVPVARRSIAKELKE